jgi:hypothetical protein
MYYPRLGGITPHWFFCPCWQASKRAEIAVRRHKALELKIAGHSDRAIARIFDIDVSTAHRDAKNVLEAMAREHAEEAANLRSLLNIRYEEIFHAYYDQAVAGDVETTKIAVSRMHSTISIPCDSAYSTHSLSWVSREVPSRSCASADTRL